MTNPKDSRTDRITAVDRPIDVRKDDRGQVLFYLAKHVPVQPAEIAAEAAQNEATVETAVKERFPKETRIDSTGFIQLTDAARHPVVQYGGQYIKTAREHLESGRRLDQDGDFDAAKAKFKTAVFVLRDLEDRFAAINYDPKQLRELIEAAEQEHDTVAREATKDAVNVLTLSARQHESAGDEIADTVPEDAHNKYRTARKEIARGIDLVNTYNESRLSMTSNKLSPRRLKEGLNAVLEKLRTTKQEPADEASPTRQDAEGTQSSEPQSRVSSKPGSTDEGQSEASVATDDPSREALLDELERLTRELGKIPSASEMREHGRFDNHQYYETFGSWHDAVTAADVDLEAELLDDIRVVADQLGKPPTGAEIDEHGTYMSSRARAMFDTWDAAVDAAGVAPVTEEDLIAEVQALDDRLDKLPVSTDMRDHGQFSVKRYTNQFGSWDNALEQAGIDKREHLKAELRRLDEEVDGKLKTRHMQELGKYSHSFVSNEFGSWTDALEAAGVEKTSMQSTSQTGQSQDDTPNLAGVEQSAFETSWESIPENERIDEQLLVHVDSVRSPRGNKKTHVLEVSDRRGKQFTFDIWKTHSLSTDWEGSCWYAVTNARGSMWETDAGETKKRLSSTKDLKVVRVGTDIDLDAGGAAPDQGQPHAPTRTPKEDAESTTSNRSGATTDAEGSTAEQSEDPSATDQEDDEIFDEILSEFDDI